MLPALTRRPLLARMFSAALTTSIRSPPLSHTLTSSSLTSFLRPAVLSAHRLFANAATSRSPAAASTSSAPPAAAATSAPSSSDAASTASAASESSSAGSASRRRGRSDLTGERQRAAEQRAKQLLRAKQQERAKRDRERAVQSRLKKQHRRIVTQEKARERATLRQQRRQELKDRLRAKAVSDKKQRAEEQAVAQRYRDLRATRPKRPLSAFLSFAQTIRTSLPASATGARHSPTETTRLLAARWRELPADERSKYEAQYRAALPAYQQALQAWTEQQRAHRPPTRPMNPYARYAKQRIAAIRASEGGGARAPELMKRVAAEWREMGADEKERRRLEVAGEAAGYEERLRAWEQRPAVEHALWRVQRETARRKRAKRKTRTALNKQAAEKAATTTQ